MNEKESEVFRQERENQALAAEMRTRPLPNRHASERMDFGDSIQATLNRNRNKPPLDTLSPTRLLLELAEEVGELVWAIATHALRRQSRRSESHFLIGEEAKDVAVVCLGLWMWSRRKA